GGPRCRPAIRICAPPEGAGASSQHRLGQRLAHEVTGVELFGNAMVLFEQRLAIDVGKLDGAHAFCTPVPHSPMSLTVGTIRLKRRVRNKRMFSDAIAASTACPTGRPRFSHSSFWLKRSRM